MAKPLELHVKLQELFGFSEFRGPQKAIIERALSGQNSLIIMPTGFGKSLCYQLPSQILEGLTLVLSPLVALMQDQVDQGRKAGLKVAGLHSGLSGDERQKRLEQLRQGQLKLLYVTPERFRKPEFREALSTQKVSLLAVDEAHCISQWGHDFRPDYSKIGEIWRQIGQPPLMALTATATQETQKDILNQLHQSSKTMETFFYGIERPNLALEVREVYGLEQKVEAFLQLDAALPGATIVYFSLIQSLYDFANHLKKQGRKFYVYHGQLSAEERRASQRKFLQDAAGLILATPAFGLGVNKPDIRKVFHAEIAGSVEAYFQEVGRAGRDGLPAKGVLLYDEDDLLTQMEFIKWTHPELSFLKSLWALLEKNWSRFEVEGEDYLREQLNFKNKRDFRVESALAIFERLGALTRDPHTQRWIRVGEVSEEELKLAADSEIMKRQQRKLHDLVQFIKTEDCRMQFVYKYFGVADSEPCGLCDLCRGGA